MDQLLNKNEHSNKIGILLTNVGTPDELTLPAVKKYLSEFLDDPFVISLPTIVRKMLVHGLIVPFRSPKSFIKYKKIWTEQGSPLRYHLNNLVKNLQEKIDRDNYLVIGAMRYGSPSLQLALKKFEQNNIFNIIVLPLYPQWSQSTTESVILKLNELSQNKFKLKFKFKFIEPFFKDPHFLACHKQLIENSINNFKPDFILFSFHGLPDKPIAQRYFQECQETAIKLSDFIGDLPFKISFQSRLGLTKWLEPATDTTIKQVAAQGYKRLMVVSPSFVADGLETLEELAIEGAQQFKTLTANTGEFYLVPSLNSSPDWVEAISKWIRNQNV